MNCLFCRIPNPDPKIPSFEIRFSLISQNSQDFPWIQFNYYGICLCLFQFSAKTRNLQYFSRNSVSPPRFPKMEETGPHPFPHIPGHPSPCLALTLNQVREGSGLPPMAKHTSFTRVPARRGRPCGGPSIHSFWAGSETERVALLFGLSPKSRVSESGGSALPAPWGEDGGSHLTFRVSDFLKVSFAKASLKASQVRVRPLSSRRTRNVRLDMEMWPP